MEKIRTPFADAEDSARFTAYTYTPRTILALLDSSVIIPSIALIIPLDRFGNRLTIINSGEEVRVVR